MLSNLTGWHFLIILVVVLLLFGAPKLPALARSLGQSLKILRSEVREDGAAVDDGSGVAPVAGAAPASSAPMPAKRADAAPLG
ncbi:twin-arginine translocase TatA/TatE family subunit [Agromyces sp. MMS24-K17]|uniref:twin-arginine translocase TatA/TatE family subunit n=1 Tax=Agromyces sp. MMS24-K17 TaxID=3372850 RepID=UPI003754093C